MTGTPETRLHAEEAEGRRSLVETWTEVVADASGLIQLEAGLARAETAANMKALGRSTLTVVAGVVLCMTALIFLAVAAVVGLAALIGMGFALLAVALVCTVVGVVLIRFGQSKLADQTLLPDKSLQRISADLQRLSARGRAAVPAFGDSHETP